MKTARRLVALAVLLGIALARGWTEPFHLWVGAAVMAIAGGATMLWRRSHRADEEAVDPADDEPADSLPRACFLGLLTGLVASALLATAFAGAGRIDPVTRLFCDSDRTTFEAHLAAVIAARDHARASELIERRLSGGKLSRSWRRTLNQSLYQQLLEAADTTTTLADRTNRLHRAVSAAQAAGLDDRLAVERLQRAGVLAATRGKLEELRSNRRWSELVTALQFSMKGKPMNEWEVPYGQWLQDAYVAWAKDSPDLTAKREKLGQAVIVAKDFGLDSSPVLALLQAIEKEAAVGDLVQTAEARVREQAQRERKQAERESRYQGLLEAGDKFSDPDPLRMLEGRRELYAKAQEFAAANGLQVAAAAGRRARCDAELAALLAKLPAPPQPVRLPPGAQARVVRIGADRFPPSIDLEVAVEDAQHQAIRGLTAMDFQVTLGQHAITNLAVAPILTLPPPLQLVVAVDCSGSITGSPIRHAIEGAQVMIRGLASEVQVQVRVLTFSSRVESRCPWTSDLSKAADALTHCAAKGETALLAAVETGRKELAGRPGDRRLLLFTDGADTASPRSLKAATLIAVLKAEGIQVHAIGLRTKDLDRTSLEQLASGTGGLYFEAATAAEIATQFLAARNQLRRESYRLVISPNFDVGVGKLALEVRVGGGPAVIARGFVEVNRPPQTAWR